jgi:tRNA 5-methylaminomethyl-2-thiouridine biosynthesis bifunctional protein
MAVLAAVLEGVPELARVLDPALAATFLGIDQPSAGYWFPRSGWLRPGAVCRSLASHPCIRLVEQCGEIRLSAIDDGWRASDAAGRAWEASCAVIAAGTASTRVAGLEWLPLQSIRGQTTRLPSGGDLGRLRAALCHEGYIAPARAGMHCIGATFNLDDTDPAQRLQDHQRNLAALARAVPAWQGILGQCDSAALDGRVGFRCASPDYLPVVGPVPDRSAFLRDFAALGNNARQVIPVRGEYHPGLFLSTAHGSRGLTSTPLAAELLASQICLEPPPLSRELCRALAPARFIIRDLSRNRIQSCPR